MSKTVDSRVVEMRFDNAQFESNVRTSMSTLEKLKQSLNLKGASKGLEGVSNAAKKVDFSGMGKGIETVQAKFSALQVAGVTALANITNSAVNAGKRIASALTIDPIKTGFHEYETQIGAIQTILANTQSKGSTLQDVNRALDELNTYADKTIYNFTEMTRNIGTFTAAGVDLDKSVTSIKGIANLAAVSGSTSAQASQAMYQLSQALAAGRVSLMDWNSVVNAGMGGELFQNALKRTAENMGHNVDALIEKYGSFRESLTQGQWLTTEVLTETLTQLSGAYTEADLIAQGYTEQQAKDIVQLAETAVGAATEVKTFTQLWDTLKESVQSGWTQSWETIIGDFGEAKELLTGISDALGGMIQASADARNKVLTEGLSSGWKQLLGEGIADEEGFKDTIKSVAKDHGIAVDEMIDKNGSFEKSLKEGWMTGDILAESLDKMTKKINGLSDEQLKEMGYTSDQVKELNKLNEAVKNGTVDIDEYAKKMSMASGRENMIAGFKNIFDSLLAVIKPIGEAFREIFPTTTGEQLYEFTVKFKEFTETLKVSDETAGKIKSTFKGLFSVLDIVVEAFKAVGKGAVTLIGSLTGIGGGILSATGSFGDFLSNVRDSIVEGNLFGKAVDKVVGILTGGISAVKEFGKTLKESIDISSTFQGFLGFFDGLWNVIKSIGSAIGEAFGDIGRVISDAFGKGDIFEVINSGLFASILLAIRNFISGLSDPFEKISFLDRVKEILDGVKGSLEAWQQNLKASTLLKIAAAIGILAAALYVISGIDSDKLGQSLGSIAVLFGELVGAMALLEKLNDSSIKPLAGIVGSLANISRTISMIGLSAAVVILAGAMKTLASLDWNGVAKGLVGVAGLTGILVAAAKLMDGNSKSITKFAGQMVVLSAAIGALAVVAKYLSSMSWGELAKGGAGILGIVVMLVGAAKIMDSDSKSITKFAGQMLIMSAAIGVLAVVGKTLSSMSWGELAKSGVAILGLITILVAAAKIMDSSSASITKFGGQMLLMSASLAVLTPVLKSLGSLSVETLAKGLITIGIAIAELSFGLKSMNGSLGGSAALLVAATALATIAPTLKLIGSMSIGSIAKSLITLAAAFAVIGVAGYLLSPLTPVILGLAGAFALFGVATLGIGAGMTLIAAGFTALATAGAAGATAFVAALTVIVTGVLELVPTIARIIGEGIVEIAKILGDYAPQLAESFLKLISGVLDSLATYAPQIVDSLLTFIIGVINSLADHMPELITAVMNLVGQIFAGVAEALNGLDTANLLKGVLAVGLMTALMYALSGVVALIPSAMAGLLGVGLVIAELTLILAAIGGLAQIPGLQWLITEGGNLLEKVGTAIGQFVGGIVGGFAQGVSSSFPQIASDLSAFMQNIQPFIQGAQQIDPSAMEGVKTLAETILLLTAADILDGIASFITGGSSLSSFAEQLVPFGEGMKKYAASVAGIDTAAITASADAAKALAEVGNAIPKEGGLWGLLSGDRDLGSFGEKLVPFGEGMKKYAASVAGIDTASIVASAEAAKALAEVGNAIPKEGGLWGLLSGDRDLGSFGTKLVPFGLGMKLYSSAVAGLNSESIVASAAAAKAIVEVAQAIPAEGGLWQLITGDKDLAAFGEKLVPFGNSMRSYASAVAGIDTMSILLSAAAASAIVSVAEAIPTEGGLWQLIAGDKDLASFGLKLVPFGNSMRLYAAAVAGIDTMSILMSAAAAKALVSVAEAIPSDGGIWQLIDGDKDLASFGQKLVPFGLGMKSYATSVAGIDTMSILLSATAAKALVSVAEAIPSEGGLWSLIDGDKDLGSFGQKLVPFGQGMKSYAAAVAGIDTMSIIMSATAAKALVSVANAIPSEGGLWDLIAGGKDLGSFGMKLVPFGIGMRSYATAVAGIDTASIVMSVSAAKAMVNVADAIPKEGGLWGLLSGEKDIGSFGQKLVPFGRAMKSYGAAVAGMDTMSITASVSAAKAMVNVAKSIPADLSVSIGSDSISSFAQKLTSFGSGMKAYSASVTGLNVGSIAASVSAAKSLVSLINSTANVNTSGVGSFVSAINKLGTVSIDGIVESFSGASTKMLSAGSNLIESVTRGMQSRQSALMGTVTNLVISAQMAIISRAGTFGAAGLQLMTMFVTGIRSTAPLVSSSVQSAISSAAASIIGYYSSFYSAGAYLGSGLVLGINSKKTAAYNAGYALGQAAVQGEKDGQASNSPSKLTIQAGKWLGEGLVIGIEKMGTKVYKAGHNLGDSAASSMSTSIARVAEAINTDIDAQPTIRPVLDLDDIKAGAGTIDSLLSGGASVGVNANLNAISTMMNRNGDRTNMDDVVFAINKLRKDLGNVGNTSYNINGVTYDDGSNVTDAVRSLVRAIRVERRI